MPSESVNSRCAAPIRVEVAKFEDWDPACRGFDAVVAAQAWNWVNPVAGAAKAAAVLRPGARLAVFWNAFDPPEDLRVAFGDVFRRVLPDSPIAGFWDRPAVEGYRAGCLKVAEVLRQAAPSPCRTRRSPPPPSGWSPRPEPDARHSIAVRPGTPTSSTCARSTTQTARLSEAVRNRRVRPA